MLKIKEISSVELFMGFEKENIAVFVYADWCGPCKLMFPFLEEIIEDKKNNIFKINIDKNMEIAEKYEIKGVPTIIYFKNGKVEKKIKGYKNKIEILQLLEG